MLQFRSQFMIRHAVYHDHISSIECDLNVLIADMSYTVIYFCLAVNLKSSRHAWQYCNPHTLSVRQFDVLKGVE